MNPRNPTDGGSERRALDRLLHDIENHDPEPFCEFSGPLPEPYVPESRYEDLTDDERCSNILKAFEPLADLRPLSDLFDPEHVRDRLYAHCDVSDVSLAHELGTTRHTCDIRAYGREFHGTGTTHGLAASDALFRLRAWRDACDERNDVPAEDEQEGGEA